MIRTPTGSDGTTGVSPDANSAKVGGDTDTSTGHSTRTDSRSCRRRFVLSTESACAPNAAGHLIKVRLREDDRAGVTHPRHYRRVVRGQHPLSDRFPPVVGMRSAVCIKSLMITGMQYNSPHSLRGRLALSMA